MSWLLSHQQSSPSFSGKPLTSNVSTHVSPNSKPKSAKTRPTPPSRHPPSTRTPKPFDPSPSPSVLTVVNPATPNTSEPSFPSKTAPPSSPVRQTRVAGAGKRSPESISNPSAIRSGNSPSSSRSSPSTNNIGSSVAVVVPPVACCRRASQRDKLVHGSLRLVVS